MKWLWDLLVPYFSQRSYQSFCYRFLQRNFRLFLCRYVFEGLSAQNRVWPPTGSKVLAYSFSEINKQIFSTYFYFQLNFNGHFCRFISVVNLIFDKFNYVIQDTNSILRSISSDFVDCFRIASCIFSSIYYYSSEDVLELLIW